MSEELLQITPITLGRYQFYKLGATTLSQLRSQKIIRAKFPPEMATRKPDGLIVLPGGDVKAVIEYKQPSELHSTSDINKAILQMIDVAKQFCKLLIVTSGDKSFWINTFSGNRILTESGHELVQVFDAKAIAEGRLSTEQLADFESLLDKIDYSLSPDNDQLEQPAVVDPSSLARSMWQKIWINTGKEPEKCLYNVVELFVFKFLSDVGVLRSHNNFQSVFTLCESDSATEALKHYANTCRLEIRELFPEADDGTTIINGTIFVNEQGKPNLSQSRLFGEVLTQLQDYDSQYGSFKYIKKDFKTRLYESFLRQSAGVRFLGQYFTPRNVVQAMVAMSNAHELREGSRICDPFCGVGGFILETIAANPHILKEFEPVNGVVAPSITLLGFDKGTDEKEDERTIILAKANMLIYFSDLLVKYNSRDNLRAFSEGAFNKVFHLIRSNIGTFGKTDEQPFDLILTNPPYVTSGSSSLKAAIEEEGLGNSYTSGGRGTESLAVEWIIRNLKPNGQALAIVPDGLLIQSNVLHFVLRECIVQGIISLPSRAFYSTRKKTYILVLKRKYSPQEAQTQPVFTYLVSEIGESRDARRLKIEQNDLTDAVHRFNQFKGSPDYYLSDTLRCKIVNFKEFKDRPHWMVDRWWSPEEKLSLNIENDAEEISEEEFLESAQQISALIHNFVREYQDVASVFENSEAPSSYKQVWLDDAALFEYVTKRTNWTRRDYPTIDTGNIVDTPVYTAAQEPVAYVTVSNEKLIFASREQPLVSFGSNGDGSAGTNLVLHEKPFYVSNDRTVLRILDPNISAQYVICQLLTMKRDYGFGFHFKAIPKNLGDVSLNIPVTASGEFDYDAQNRIVAKFKAVQNIQEALHTQVKQFQNANFLTNLPE